MGARMSRSRGRRTAVKTSTGARSAASRRFEPALIRSVTAGWLLPVLILLVLSCLVLMALVTSPQGRPVRLVPGAASSTQTLVCGGGIPGIQLVTTAAPAGAAAVPDQSMVISGEVAGDARKFASQWAKGPGAFAFATCAQPRANWWVIGAGGSQTHPSRMIIDNPRSGTAIVDISALSSSGPVAAPGLRGIAIDPGRRLVVDLAQMIPSASDLAVRVNATRGLVTVTTVEEWSHTVIGKPKAEWVPGQPAAARELVITGLPPQTNRASLIVANPSDSEVIVKVLAIGSSGTFAPKGAASLSVPAASVGALDVSSAFDGKPIAFKLLSESPVSATVRSVVQGDQTYGQVATGFVGSSQIGLPLRAQSKVLVSSVGRSGRLEIQAFDQAHQPLGEPISRTVDAGTSSAIDLPAGTVEVMVSSDSTSLVSGLIVLHGKGVSGGAFTPPAEVGSRPKVLPGW